MNNSHENIMKACRGHSIMGLTRCQIEEKTGLGQGSVCARVKELIEMRMLEPAGTRFCSRARRQVEVLKVVR